MIGAKAQTLSLLMISGAVPLASASAAPFQSAYVIAEQDSSAHATCSVTNTSVEAAIKAALRYNGIEIVPVARDDSVTVWFSLTPVQSSPSNCGASYDIEFYDSQLLNFPGGGTFFGSAVFCSLGGALNWPKSELQTKMNSKMRDLVDQCVTKIETKVRK